MKKIVFASSEAVPFIKTGGLADVAGSLPKAFPKEKYDVRVILPKYLCILEEYRLQMKFLGNFYMHMGSMIDPFYVGIMEYELDGIIFYFVDNEHYFGVGNPYTKIEDDVEKFAFFSKAVLAVLPVIDFQPDIIHCHDWQSALIPVYLRTLYSQHPFYARTKTIMTVHNLRFQGIHGMKQMKFWSGLPDYVFTPDRMEFMRDANMLKGGMVFADYITTVSDTYAKEIQTLTYGEGLDGALRFHNQKLRGIVNGIDYDDFNPASDSNIRLKYTVDTFRRAKPINKLVLQEEFGLEPNKKAMLIGLVSRLTDQKGLDLVAHVLDELCGDAIQLVVLGTGEKKYEDMFHHFAWKHPGKVSANIYYSEAAAHKIYAGCDAFLMPSQFEPCGLSQLISLRYGTVPIVRETGGLKDTVEPYNEFEKTGTGFSFANYNAHEMLDTIRYAERIYFDYKKDWNKIVQRGMNLDFSWEHSAEKYMELYDMLIG